MSKLLTLSLLYFNDYDHLYKHIDNWEDYKSHINIQIIDDCSSEPLAEKLNDKKESIIDVPIYRVNTDIKWNIPGVRNLGATVCETEWILFCDMDQYFLKQDMENILLNLNNPNFNKNKYYSFSRHGRGKTMGTMLLTKQNFWKCGGYDEDLVGNYGYNDPLLRKQLESINIHEHTFENIYCQQFEADCKLDRKGIKKNRKKFLKKTKSLPRKSMNVLRFNWEQAN